MEETDLCQIQMAVIQKSISRLIGKNNGGKPQGQVGAGMFNNASLVERISVSELEQQCRNFTELKANIEDYFKNIQGVIERLVASAPIP